MEQSRNGPFANTVTNGFPGNTKPRPTFKEKMGYTTYFTGQFKVTPMLTENEAEFLRAFAGSRRMKRDEKLVEALPDTRRINVGLPVGKQGQYYVGAADDGNFGQSKWVNGGNEDASITNYNEEPDDQPGLWCKWVPTEDRTGIEWNGIEKFYNYTEWLEYLIDHFLRPWGKTVNGQVKWVGENKNDRGILMVENNIVAPVVGTRKVIVEYGDILTEDATDEENSLDGY